MTTRGLSLLLAFAIGNVAWAASHRGQVRFVSSKRAYLSAGGRDGLAVGATVTLKRNGRTITTCIIDQLGDRQSACPTPNARIGDTFSLPTAPAAATVVHPLPAPPTPVELHKASQALADHPVDKVDFKGSARIGSNGATLFTGSYAHNSFITFANGGNFEQERFELQLNGVDIRWAGFRVFAHVTAILSSARPLTQRFRPGDLAQIYVWEAAATSRDTGRPFTVSVGRIWPYHTPGLSVLDGAQAAWRGKDGATEIGAYGGTVPDPTTLYPSWERWTAGAYYAYTLARGGKKSALRLLQTDGRLGMRGISGPGPQLELEAALMASLWRWLDLGVQARASIGAGDWSHPVFDAARAHFTVRPTDKLRLVGTFRYLDEKTADYDGFAPSFFALGRMYHATFDLGWDAKPWLSLQLMSGLDHESDSGSRREYVGPEIGFPTLFHHKGGIAIGYREEFGWFAGRNAYLQLMGGVGKFRLMGRVSYYEDRPGGGFSTPSYREVGAYFFAEGRILRWLSARVSAMGRLGVDGFGSENVTPAGLVVRAELTGSL